MKDHKDLENLFKRLEGSFDVHDTPDGHQRRFLDKLNSRAGKSQKPRIAFKRWTAVAASIVLFIALGASFLATNKSAAADLSSVSPEMEQTQSFFTATIAKELHTLKSNQTPENKDIIEDALRQIDILEKEYQQLKKDLVLSGQNERVVQAMVDNFQNRISLLEHVLETLESIKTLKNKTDETLL